MHGQTKKRRPCEADRYFSFGKSAYGTDTRSLDLLEEVAKGGKGMMKPGKNINKIG
jgi:hypothetical protein